MNKLTRFLRLNSSDRRLLVRTWLLLMAYGTALRVRSVRSLTTGLQHHREPVSPQPVRESEQRRARRVGAALAVASRYTPWHGRCLVQALAGSALLRQEGIAGQLCIGVRSSGREMRSADESRGAGFGAHAWLACGQSVICGAVGYEQYRVMSSYSWALANDNCTDSLPTN